MKKEGYRESTIVSRVKLLASLARRANLLDPESIKVAIARLDVTEARKEVPLWLEAERSPKLLRS